MTVAARPPRARPAFGVSHVQVHGFRTARSVSFSPGPIAALVGDGNTGKSNLLAALRAVLDPDAAPVRAEDVTVGDGEARISATLASGSVVTLTGARPADVPPVLFLPAAERSRGVLADTTAHSGPAAKGLDVFLRALREQLGGPSGGVTAPAQAVVDALEACCAFGVPGVVLLMEEPELFLRPQAQRYLYRLVRRFAAGGNQVIYSTHSPAFLNVARLHELVLVDRTAEGGTRALQPPPPPPDQDFRVLSEFDAERSELFLARAAVLVEGQTEKLALPFVFAALGHDPDREGISIVECGGKANIPLFAGVCRAVGVPFVAVHDRDAPTPAEQRPNALIADSVGSGRVIVLDPDFEGVAGLRGHAHKPERAWRRFGSLGREDLPARLAETAVVAVALAREGSRR